jgi:hypothetical protein
MPNPTGRPSKLTPDLAERIVAAVRDGAFPHAAAEAAGVPLRSFYRWMAQGEIERRGRYAEFRHMIHEAAAQARIAAQAQVYKANPEGWLSKGPGRTTVERSGCTEPWAAGRAQPPAAPVTVRVVYTLTLANGEHLPEMNAAEFDDFRRWRREHELARRIVPLPVPSPDEAEPVRAY